MFGVIRYIFLRQVYRILWLKPLNGLVNMDFENVLDKSLVGSEPDEWFNVTTVSYYIDDVLNNVLIIKYADGLFQLQMRILFPFLRSKDLRTSLLIMKNLSFYCHVHRGYIRKVSVHLVQNVFSMIAVLIVFIVVNGEKGI